jgi:hypothetical protein
MTEGMFEDGRQMTDPDPVKYVVGAIFGDESIAGRAIECLEEDLGEVDYVSPVFVFDATNYYCDEMGSPLYRKFYAFKRLASPGDLARVKVMASRIEEQFARQGRRQVNLDPGYVDIGKYVLASFKYKVDKVYLDRGVYADPTLYYENRTFLAYPWSFPDMKCGVYSDTFLHIRKLYKENLRELRKAKS